jgi:hypothetical protein
MASRGHRQRLDKNIFVATGILCLRIVLRRREIESVESSSKSQD